MPFDLFLLISVEYFHDFIYLSIAYLNPYLFLELCGIKRLKLFANIHTMAVSSGDQLYYLQIMADSDRQAV
jgi:hypothetical protein